MVIFSLVWKALAVMCLLFSISVWDSPSFRLCYHNEGQETEEEADPGEAAGRVLPDVEPVAKAQRSGSRPQEVTGRPRRRPNQRPRAFGCGDGQDTQHCCMMRHTWLRIQE